MKSYYKTTKEREMILKVNGKKRTLSDGLTVLDLLTEEKVIHPETVSVELNGEIIDREMFKLTNLKADDEVELLYFMGGGNFNKRKNQ